MDRRVVITGMGAITPVGNNIDTFWNNIINGVCGIDRIKNFNADELYVKIAGEVKEFNPSEHGMPSNAAKKNDRYALFAMAAANEAMTMSGLERNGELIIPSERLGVYIGSGIGGMHTFVNETTKLVKEGHQWISPLFIPMMISNIASGNVAIAHNATGVCLPVVTACATGTHSIGEAYRAIKHGYADAIIAGGAEATVNPLAISGFANSKALSRSEDPLNASLPFDIRRQGFVIAEGAGVIVLEEYEQAKMRGARIFAEVCGYGNTCDAYHYTAPRPDGSCAARAFKQALDEGGYTSKDILHINAHGTGTPLNDKSETAAIKLAMGEEQARKVAICSTKSMTGHMLGAAGGVEIIAAALALEEGIVPPTIGLKESDPECDLDYTPLKARKLNLTMALSSSLGFGGHNACVALRKI
jgi:3-oxoacyl-[acyl-carrier-protein] synthase II